MIKLYHTSQGLLIKNNEGWRRSPVSALDDLFEAEDPTEWLEGALANFDLIEEPEGGLEGGELLPPLMSQEVWAAGVTYYRSREARMEESEKSGGDVFYDKVYDAERPELFFKGSASRTVGHKQKVVIRKDSMWNVPEPEYTLAVNAKGKIFGYTIGNDMSSRDIEGANPLYLPQAKVYRGACALGPALVIMDPPGKDTAIRLEIERGGETVFEGKTGLDQLKRKFEELVGFLFRDNVFPNGAYLLTGAGIVPGGEFTLNSGDIIRITIDGLGTLENEVE